MEIYFFAGLIIAWLFGVRSVAKEKVIAGLFERFEIDEIDVGREFRWGLFAWRGNDGRRIRYTVFTMMSSDDEVLALRCIFPVSLWLNYAVIPWSEVILGGRKRLIVGFGTYAVIKFKNGVDGEILIPIDLIPSDLRS